MVDEVEVARDAFDRRAWGQALRGFAVISELEAFDLERVAIAEYLTGSDEGSERGWERAQRAFAGVGDVEGAARCSFWLGLTLMLRGESARASGWLARAERYASDTAPGCSARGYVLLPSFLAAVDCDPWAAQGLVRRIVEIAHQCGDADLLALGLLGSGQAEIACGAIDRGLRLLDEAMVAVIADEVSVVPAGIIYCGVIEGCVALSELGRASEWTEALHRWCAAQPDLVPYRGQCLVHRSQVLQARGDWTSALVEAEHARRRLAEPAHPALGLALYQRADLLRLRGDRGALDDVVSMSAPRVPLFASVPVADDPVFQHDTAHADAALRAARSLLYDTTRHVWDLAERRVEPTPRDRADVRAAAVWIAAQARSVTSTAYHWGGGAAIYGDNPLQRRLRDLDTLSQHFLLRRNTLTTAGSILTGHDLDTPLF